MTTSLQVRTAWDARVWQHSSVIAITNKIYDYDILIDSEKDVGKLLDADKIINFFNYLVARETDVQIMGQVTQTFAVLVQYTHQQSGFSTSNYNTVMDNLELVDAVVLSSLSGNWNSTVDYYTGAKFQQIKEIEVDGRKCWQGGYLYTAFKNA